MIIPGWSQHPTVWDVDFRCAWSYTICRPQLRFCHKSMTHVLCSYRSSQYCLHSPLAKWDWQICYSGSFIMEFKRYDKDSSVHLNFIHMPAKAVAWPHISELVSHTLTQLNIISQTVFSANGNWQIFSDRLSITICAQDSPVHLISNQMPPKAAALL